jgi:hypothetical protein
MIFMGFDCGLDKKKLREIQALSCFNRQKHLQRTRLLRAGINSISRDIFPGTDPHLFHENVVCPLLFLLFCDQFAKETDEIMEYVRTHSQERAA